MIGHRARVMVARADVPDQPVGSEGLIIAYRARDEHVLIEMDDGAWVQYPVVNITTYGCSHD